MVEKFTSAPTGHTKWYDLLLQAVMTKLHPKPFSFSLKTEQNL